MSKNMMITAIVIVVVLVGGALLLSQNQSQKPTPATTTENAAPTEAMMEEKEATGAMEKEDDAMMAKTVIETKNFAFVNKTYTVKAGETVTFKNSDTAGHSVTSDDESFDTDVVGKDQTATFKAPTKPGKYPFHCTPHPNMKATLVVE